VEADDFGASDFFFSKPASFASVTAALSEDASVSAVAYKFLAPIQIRENKTITPQPISIFFFISGPHHHIQILFP
jgi:hypothetical protein